MSITIYQLHCYQVESIFHNLVDSVFFLIVYQLIYKTRVNSLSAINVISYNLKILCNPYEKEAPYY